ncbi:MAG: peptidoglycan-associated lipoprotein Pal [Desulfuromonadia bacterium]
MKSRIVYSVALVCTVAALAGCASKESVKKDEPIASSPSPTAQQTPPPAPKPAPTPSPAPAPAPKTVEQPVAPAPVKGESVPESTQPAVEEFKGALETVYFAFDSSELTDQSRDTLYRNAEILIKKTKGKFFVEGHCDERGSDEYNLALGERRARAAYQYLVTLGVAPERLSIISYGEERPVDPGHTEEAWAKNRRVEITPAK